MLVFSIIMLPPLQIYRLLILMAGTLPPTIRSLVTDVAITKKLVHSLLLALNMTLILQKATGGLWKLVVGGA